MTKYCMYYIGFLFIILTLADSSFSFYEVKTFLTSTKILYENVYSVYAVYKYKYYFELLLICVKRFYSIF